MDTAGLPVQHGEACASFIAASACPPPGAMPAHAPPSLMVPWLKRTGKGPLLWGMGGTLLSALGFIALALFEQYNDMLTELRNDLKHFNETCAELVKKDSMQRLRDQLKVRFKEIEETNTVRKELELELHASERAREEMARELQRMRERLAFVEGRQTATPNIAASCPPPP